MKTKSKYRIRLPKLVWHYTSFKGLDGILKGKIWASSAAYLNDTKEFRYAIEIAAEEFKVQIDKHPPQRMEDITDENISRYRIVSQLRTVVGRQFHGIQATDVFITSFSKKRDHLSQWQAYGGRVNKRCEVSTNKVRGESQSKADV